MEGPEHQLDARYYRALPVDKPGYEEETLSLPVGSTALVGLHCWNIGCPDGPPVDVDYCAGMGWPQATEEAARIMVEVIRLAMDAARAIDMSVCHVETEWMGHRYPDLSTRRSPKPENLHPHRRALLDRAHGPDYMAESPLAEMRRAVIVSPVDDEPLFFYSDQLDEYLRDQGIDTLIYTGFATDMCILGAEGGARIMASHGYRCILMSDAAIGVETPESFPQRLATNYGIHIFEWSLGHGTTFEQFKTACDRVGAPCSE